jgi:hypothetical protein
MFVASSKTVLRKEVAIKKVEFILLLKEVF